MKKIIFTMLALAQMASANSVVTYTGTSPISYNNKNVCLVALTLNSMKQVIAVVAKGPAKKWEIIAENSDGYGPSSEIVFDDADDLLAKPETFAQLRLQRKNHFWSEGYTLKSTVTAEGTIRAQFEVEFNIQNSQLISLKKKSKFKAAVFVPLASQELVCENLKKVSQR